MVEWIPVLYLLRGEAAQPAAGEVGPVHTYPDGARSNPIEEYTADCGPPWWWSAHQLLAAVDVVGRTSQSGVGHDVYGEGGDVGWPHDSPDRECRAELIATTQELVRRPGADLEVSP